MDVAFAKYPSSEFAGIITDGKHKKDFPQTVREGLGLQIFTHRARGKTPSNKNFLQGSPDCNSYCR